MYSRIKVVTSTDKADMNEHIDGCFFSLLCFFCRFSIDQPSKPPKGLPQEWHHGLGRGRGGMSWLWAIHRGRRGGGRAQPMVIEGPPGGSKE